MSLAIDIIRGRKMFNLENLNDYEFELLCKDIMEMILNKKLYTFPKGRDGGIDICDAKVNPEIIIQAKHYINSKYSDLLSALKNEIPKVKNLSPKEYFICSGLKLTKKQKNEIFELFKEYMDDCSNIIDSIEINDFLSEEKNKEIVNKHFKLWLCSSSVLDLLNSKNVFIDCEELLCDIEVNINLYVQTKSYFEAKKRLLENGVIIITGAPGVGKSTISKMLLLAFANDNYIIRYTTDNDISNIKKIISNDPAKKEIILLDDFLGQHYLKIKDSQPNEIKTLISFIRKNPNKKIILNSRITIIKEATQSYIQFKTLMDENMGNEYLINLDKMDILEKAKILYNHIYFNCLPQKYFAEIKKNKNYLGIIQHKNYNPRIIEYVTKSVNYLEIPVVKYKGYIMSKLDFPEDVWRDEFRNRLDEIDRIFMNTLYSLTNTGVEDKILEKAFNQRVRNSGFMNSSINAFKNTANRLCYSLIKITEERGKIKIHTINPSVNDYLNSEIITNENEQINIMKNAVYIEQIFKVLKDEEPRKILFDLVFTGEILKMPCLYNSQYYYFLRTVIDYKIFDKKISDNFTFSMEHLSERVTDVDDYSIMIEKMLSADYILFYELENVFLDVTKMYYILRAVDYKYLEKISDKHIDEFEYKFSGECQLILKVFNEIIVQKISDIAKERVNEDIYGIVSDKCDLFVDEDGDIDKSALRNSVDEQMTENIWEYIESQISCYNRSLKLESRLFSINEIMENMEFEDTYDSIMQGRSSGYNSEDYRSNLQASYDEIICMFER